jgi:hypothetical protein
MTSAAELREVSRMTGIHRVASADLIAWQKAKPSIFGMVTSEMIRSGVASFVLRRPCSPSEASSTS